MKPSTSYALSSVTLCVGLTVSVRDGKMLRSALGFHRDIRHMRTSRRGCICGCETSARRSMMRRVKAARMASSLTILW